MTGKPLRDIEVVEDRTAEGRLDDGFLRLRRLRVRNVYADGTRSAPYPCDVVSRRQRDAVAVVVWSEDADRCVRVALREGVRPPVTLRRGHRLVQPDERIPLLLAEIVAGLLEDGDTGPDGPARRGAIECREEAGYAVEPGAVRPLGAATFPSPGAADEKVLFRHVRVADLDAREAPTGDGSVMEEAGGVVLLPIDEAIHRCRAGGIPDAKTEIALLRLCDAIGYLPQHGCFADALPEAARPDPARLAWLLGGSPRGA